MLNVNISVKNIFSDLITYSNTFTLLHPVFYIHDHKKKKKNLYNTEINTREKLQSDNFWSYSFTMKQCSPRLDKPQC